jgi:hypothetical protein
MMIYAKNTAVSGKKKMSRSTASTKPAMITRYVKRILDLLIFDLSNWGVLQSKASFEEI